MGILNKCEQLSEFSRNANFYGNSQEMQAVLGILCIHFPSGGYFTVAKKMLTVIGISILYNTNYLLATR